MEIGRDVLFELKCQKFVEMMRDYVNKEGSRKDTELSDEDHCSVNSGRQSICYEEEHDADENSIHSTGRRRSVGSGCATTPSMHVPGANRQRRLSYAAIAAYASPNNHSNGFLAFSASPQLSTTILIKTRNMPHTAAPPAAIAELPQGGAALVAVFSVLAATMHPSVRKRRSRRRYLMKTSRKIRRPVI